MDAISLLSSIRLFAQSLCPMLSLQFFPRCIDLTEGPVSTTALMAPGDAQQENWRSVQRGLRREQRKMLSGSSCPGSSAILGRSRARHQSASSSGAGLLFVECSGQYADRGHFGGAAIRCGLFRAFSGYSSESNGPFISGRRRVALFRWWGARQDVVNWAARKLLML